MKYPNLLSIAIGLTLAAGLTACGGGSGTSTTPTAPPVAPSTAKVAALISDASSEDWSTIGVCVVSIALVPQGGGTPVNVYSASGTAPMINLVQLDQLAEILGNATVPVGAYTAAVLTVSANPGDVLLTASATPTAGFAGAPGSTIDPAQIKVQGATGSTGSLTVPVTVQLDTPLTVSTSGSNALDLEFDLAHPAFIVAHTPIGGGQTLWAVNFNGPLRHHPIAALEARILRHAYGTVTQVSSDNKSITLTKDLPTLPIVHPETSVPTTQSLVVQADSANGSIYYDVDAKTHAVINDFSSIASTLTSKYVRIAARYQQDGSLVATRIWASNSFNSVWVSPEGHVQAVDTTANTLTVTNESGGVTVLGVDANTQFFKRGSTATETTPIGTGPAFLANIVAGFKVHASVVDPLAANLTAQTIEIETAAFSGLISAADGAGVTYTRKFRNSANDYVRDLPYIAASSPNGTDLNGNSISGFKWWNFAYPTVVDSGANAITDFVTLSTGSIDFGGSLGPIRTYGVTFARWNDPAAPDAWSAPWAVILPSPLPVATVTTGLDSNNAFTMTAVLGANPVTVDVGTSHGSATLAYQVDRQNGTLTVSPLDLTSSTGLATLVSDLVAGARVRVAGVPQPDHTIKAYSVAVYTGTPAN
jgi:Domain of unknown function (DUF4382)/Domain of unknown function (DUF5666)